MKTCTYTIRSIQIHQEGGIGTLFTQQYRISVLVRCKKKTMGERIPMAVRESGENGVKHAATHIQIHIYVMGTHTLARLLLQNVDIGKRLWRDEGEGWECGGHHWRLLLLWCLVRFMVKCMRISWRLQWRSGSVPHMITTIEALRVDRTQPAIRFYSVPEMLWQLQMSEQKLWLVTAEQSSMCGWYQYTFLKKNSDRHSLTSFHAPHRICTGDTVRNTYTNHFQYLNRWRYFIEELPN